jgi:hypothetical protein
MIEHAESSVRSEEEPVQSLVSDEALEAAAAGMLGADATGLPHGSVGVCHNTCCMIA